MPVDLTFFETASSYTRKKSWLPEVVRRDGALCATFVNTLSARRKSLASYADLLAWGSWTASLGAAEARELAAAAAERPAEAAAAFERALELRARVARILGALAAQKMPDPDDVEALNAEIARAARRMDRVAGVYRWTWSERTGDPFDRPVWPVVLSASEVLTSVYHRYVRRCAGKDCDLLFVDRSPGAHRKYCSKTRGCADRAKARRYYHTTRKPRKDARRRQKQREEAARYWDKELAKDDEAQGEDLEGLEDFEELEGLKDFDDLEGLKDFEDLEEE